MRKTIAVILIVLSIIALVACTEEPEHEHTWNEGEITTKATCTTDGVKTYKCTECGETKTEAIAATGHSYDAGTPDGKGKKVFECSGCDASYSDYLEYAIGDTGPAGGKIFYDCDTDNGTGNADGLTSSECGWRYLEAAPADLGTYRIGYYRTEDAGSNLYVNGTGTYKETDCTGTAIGTGKTNTEKLVDTMGSEAYISTAGSDKTPYAAKACADYEIGDFDDWFLPSKDELNLVLVNLRSANPEGFALGFYWSSSEDPNTVTQMWDQFFDDTNPYLALGKQGRETRYHEFYVRPIRAF